jgi:N-acyl-D-aspartate/D-glutamate deacylase
VFYKTFVATVIAGLVIATPAAAAEDTYDAVIVNGRVMDPESGLDAVRNVGLRAGRIAAITTEAIRGRRTIDAKGLVVAPGFIDLHEHGQKPENYQFQAHDGVTTSLELEAGTADVAATSLRG